MGFGLLFVGYFLTFIMSINKLGVLFRLAGTILMLYACSKLSAYEKGFKLTMIPLSFAIGFIGAQAIYEGTDFLYSNLFISKMPFGTVYNTVVSYGAAISVLALHVFLLLAIRSIAKETDVIKIETAAIRNLFFVVLYYVLHFVSVIPSSIREFYNETMALPIFILNLAWMILNTVLLFSCYAKICDESDVDMEQKPSRFAFVNKYRAELAERQRLADERYAKRTAEKLKNKNSKKK